MVGLMKCNMLHKQMYRKRLTRKQFEKLLATGEWTPQANGKVRVNGELRTTTEPGWKIIFGKGWKIRGKTWQELFDAFVELQRKLMEKELVKIKRLQELKEIRQQIRLQSESRG